MTAVRALFDVVSYRSTGGHMDSVTKGEIATDMSDEAVTRHLELGSVEKVSAKEAKAAEKLAEPDADTRVTPAQEPAGDGKTDVSEQTSSQAG